MLLRKLLFAFVPLTIFLNYQALPQAQGQSASLPDITPPALRLVIVVDNSKTMLGSGNNTSLVYDYSASLGTPKMRLYTDPRSVRWQEVQRLIDMLQAEPLTTQIAIATFPVPDKTPVAWQSDSKATFFNIGQIVPITTTKSSDYQQLSSQIADQIKSPAKYQTLYTTDTAAGLSRVQNEVWAKIESDNGKTDTIKPFMLLITGDVPFSSGRRTNQSTNEVFLYNKSPLQKGTLAEWQRYIPTYYTPLQALPTYRYNGKCSDNSKGIGWAVIALGGANWVNADGSVSVPAAKSAPVPPLPFSETANASSLYNKLGDFFSKAPVPPALAVYAVDPLMLDNKDVTLRAELRNSMNDLMGKMRCVSQFIAPSPNPPKPGQFIATLPVSPLYQRVQITMDYLPNAKIGLTAPGAIAALKDGDAGVKLAILSPATSPATSRQVWILTRDTVGLDHWAGDWTINTTNASGSADAPQILVEPQVDLRELSWQPDTAANKPVDPGKPYLYHLHLLIGGKPFQDSQLIDSVSWLPEGNLSPIIFKADSSSYNSAYTGTLPSAMTSTATTYTIGIHLKFKQPIGGLSDLALPLASGAAANNTDANKLSINTQPTIKDIQPADTTLLRCEQGTQQFTVQLALRGAAQSPASLESLGTYAQVEMYYPPLSGASAPTTPDAAMSATPYARLPVIPIVTTGDASLHFATTLDCTRLPMLSGSTFLIEFVARFPGDEAPITQVFSYTFNPTNTPTPTVTPFLPTATPLATATSVPLSPDPVGDLRQTASQPLSLLLGGVLVLPLGGWLLPRLFTAYRRALLPLYKVRLQIGERGISRPVRSWPWRYLPHSEHFTLRSQSGHGKPIGTVRVRGTDEPEVSNLIDGARVQIITTARRPRMRIDYQDETFFLINNTP